VRSPEQKSPIFAPTHLPGLATNFSPALVYDFPSVLYAKLAMAPALTVKFK